MTYEDFDVLLSNEIKKILDTNKKKRTEYARNDDAFLNFRKVGSLNQEVPEKALRGMVSKHVVALWDFIEDLEQGELVPEYQWDEKIGDIIVYMFLLKGLITERFDKIPEQKN